MAEFETYHSQKVEDSERFATDYLDGEIEFYEQVSKHRSFLLPLHAYQ